MFDLTGRTALITGSSRGLGFSIAEGLAQAGAALVLNGSDAGRVATAAATLRAKGYTVHEAPFDVTNEDAVQAAFARLDTEGIEVDILFNNVGQSGRERAAQFHESQEEVWRFVLEVSLFTAMRMSRLDVPGMRERGGRIVNMSSDAALVGDAGLTDYAAAKMGVIGFTRSLARELAPHRVTVNAVAPGAIRTRAHDRLTPAVIETIKATTPAGFIAEPEDVAGCVAFLASEDARYVTGQTLLIDGGRWMI